MTNSTIFMAYYDADPKAGGILQALQADRIEVIVLRAARYTSEAGAGVGSKAERSFLLFHGFRRPREGCQGDCPSIQG